MWHTGRMQAFLYLIKSRFVAWFTAIASAAAFAYIFWTSSRKVQLAETKAEGEIERANAEAELEKQRVADEVKQQIISVAAVMASKFVAKAMDDQENDALIASFILSFHLRRSQNLKLSKHNSILRSLCISSRILSLLFAHSSR